MIIFSFFIYTLSYTLMWCLFLWWNYKHELDGSSIPRVRFWAIALSHRLKQVEPILKRIPGIVIIDLSQILVPPSPSVGSSFYIPHVQIPPSGNIQPLPLFIRSIHHINSYIIYKRTNSHTLFIFVRTHTHTFIYTQVYIICVSLYI